MVDRKLGILVVASAILFPSSLVLGTGLGPWSQTTASPAAPDSSRASAQELASGVHISVAVVDARLAATTAVADFGLEEGVRLVRVRILEEIRLELRVEAERAVTLLGPPRVCLVGPFSAPDDAGLSDRCWGEPDLAALLVALLTVDATGRPLLPAGEPLIVAATIGRGDGRCDYPPGAWQLEVTIDLLVDGVPTGDMELPKVGVEVPFAPDDVLRLLGKTRYCGLANVVYREQGEPIVEPSSL